MAKKLLLLGLILLLCILSFTGCGSTADSKSTAGPTMLAAASQDYPNARLLVSAASVQNNLHASNMVLIDARGAGYATSHIPGAINLKHSDFWTGGTGLKPVATLQTMLGNSGLRRDMTFVIYDDTTASWGAAGRVFWMLEYLGCGDVHILNGGWDKWVADGRPTETATNTLALATFTAAIDNTKRGDKLNILNRLPNSNFAVIDARTDEEYLGWQLYGEARGGHIPGAVNIPYAWFFQTDKTVLAQGALKSLLESRGITSDKEVTANCTAGIRSGFVYFTLRLMGYPQASNYDASILEWAADPVVPEEKAQNYSRVVYAGWVDSLIKGTNPSTLPAGNGYTIFDCSWGPTSTAYNAGHIPGAIHFDTNNVEARNYLDPTNPLVSDANEIVWDLVQDDLLQARLRNMGINNNTTVVVYGTTSIAVTRVYWALRYAGVDVRFLNGGYNAWIANGGAADTTAHAPVVGNLTITPQTQLKALTPEILTYADYYRANNKLPTGTVVVDVRKMEEYIGDVTGYSYDPNLTRKGRIPGAVWGHEASDAVYMDSDGTLRSYAEIRDLWKNRGITPDKTLIFYCGTGWRSTLTFLYADVMGFPNIKNYDSWYVWSTYYDFTTGQIHRDAPYNDPNAPIDTGWSDLTGL
ncbi:MAG: rhodanese-like domain-containing protein [Syntrophales bacterium]|nr:rhodanese-like domain-containing protein [Syntrophales bacterium]